MPGKSYVITMLGAISLAHAPALAEEQQPPAQFTIVDSDHYVHEAWYKFWRFPWQPEDWTAPVDYHRGYTYLRYDIRNLREPAMLQFCYFQDQHVSEKHACAPQWTFDEPGVYYRRVENRGLWQAHVIDWTRKLLDFMLIDNASEGSARTSVEVSIIVVAYGERLVAPESWQCPPEWNCWGDDTARPDPDPEDEDPVPEPEDEVEPEVDDEPEPDPDPKEEAEPEADDDPDPDPEPNPEPEAPDEPTEPKPSPRTPSAENPRTPPSDGSVGDERSDDVSSETQAGCHVAPRVPPYPVLGASAMLLGLLAVGRRRLRVARDE